MWNSKGTIENTPYDDDLAYVHDAGFSGFIKQLSPEVLEIFRAAEICEGLVVDLGCGGGLWARRLVESGFEVVGVDVSQAFVAMCRERVPSATFHETSYLDFTFPECNAVTALGEVLNYQFDKRNGVAALRGLFERVYTSLVAGGLFVFDISEPGRHAGQSKGFWEGDDWINLVEFSCDSDSQQLTRRIVTFRRVGTMYRRHTEIHHLQLFRGDEIAKLLRQVGFRVRLQRKFGDFCVANSWVGVIARKP